MILEKIPDGIDPDVLFHSIDNNLNDFGLIFSIQNLTFALKENTDTVQWKDFQRFCSNDSVKHEEKLFDMNVANETVENPRENKSQWLNVKLFELIDKFFLGRVKQFLKQ